MDAEVDDRHAKTYFHPAVDIVVFGDQLCQCLTPIFEAYKTKLDIQRIATHILGPLEPSDPGIFNIALRSQRAVDRMGEIMSFVHGVQDHLLPPSLGMPLPRFQSVTEVLMMVNPPEYGFGSLPSPGLKRRSRREIRELEPINDLKACCTGEQNAKKWSKTL